MSTLDKKDDHDLLADTITDWEENSFPTSSLTNGYPGGPVEPFSLACARQLP